MEIIYLPEPDWSLSHEAWDQLGALLPDASTLAMEGLALEGFKEVARHMWEKLVAQLKALIAWIKEKVTGLRGQVVRTRDRVETVLGQLGALKTHHAAFDHITVALTSNEFRYLAKTPMDKIDLHLLQQAQEDLSLVSNVLFVSHPDYVKTQVGLLNVAFGQFDVIEAQAQLLHLKEQLALIPFQGFPQGITNIPIVGMSELVLNKTAHPGLDSLNFVAFRMLVTAPTTAFQAPNLNLAIAMMVNTRGVLERALRFHEHMLPELEGLHQQLLHAGGVLMKRVNQLTENADDASHITSVVKQLLAVEATVARSVMQPVVPGIAWICHTTDAICSLLERMVDAASEQKAPEATHATHAYPALPAPT
jgi:hypothetical protein